MFTKEELEEFKKLVYDTDLTERELDIISLRYGFDGHPRTLEEVASFYNVTRERIRQIEAKAIRKIRENSKANIVA